MNKRRLSRAVCVFTLGLAYSIGFAQIGQRGLIPKAGYVPDAATAQKIAEAVLVPVYGEKAVVAERPYRATLKGNLWIVTGSIPCEAAPVGASCPGGVAEVHISRKDGTVTRISHGQ